MPSRLYVLTLKLAAPSNGRIRPSVAVQRRYVGLGTQRGSGVIHRRWRVNRGPAPLPCTEGTGWRACEYSALAGWLERTGATVVDAPELSVVLRQWSVGRPAVDSEYDRVLMASRTRRS